LYGDDSSQSEGNILTYLQKDFTDFDSKRACWRNFSVVRPKCFGDVVLFQMQMWGGDCNLLVTWPGGKENTSE